MELSGHGIILYNKLHVYNIYILVDEGRPTGGDYHNNNDDNNHQNHKHSDGWMLEHTHVYIIIYECNAIGDCITVLCIHVCVQTK